MILEHYDSSIEDYVIYAMHIATYNFAEKFTKDKRVLDYGCGSGYGSARISRNAIHVDAVDVAEDAIAYAQEHYAAYNIAFHCCAPDSRLPFPDQSFDTVLSFQVFEHIQKTAHYLLEIRRVLKPGGQLILVTPDRSTRLLPWQAPWNRWHIREYSTSSLKKSLEPIFQEVDILHMSGRKDVIEIELSRCAKIKWITLPFTLPFVPRFLRMKLLNVIHALKKKRQPAGVKKQFNFDDTDITITQNAQPSLNLVAVVRK
ncbi:Methyltransferase type 11 [Collimonas arenae]|uniref:Methyltransferase type 11 n=2 Tax=Collimonas arenae TaxID=279058 RepID=A0A0A1F5S4_9BURK|nr:Methyltransferase type 11 [Collimonas arenae]